MKKYSTREAARKLGRTLLTIQRYIAKKKIRAPKLLIVGKVRARLWTERDIERVRKILPKIVNGRKTRYQKEKAKKKGPKKTSKKK